MRGTNLVGVVPHLFAHLWPGLFIKVAGHGLTQVLGLGGDVLLQGFGPDGCLLLLDLLNLLGYRLAAFPVLLALHHGPHIANLVVLLELFQLLVRDVLLGE